MTTKRFDVVCFGTDQQGDGREKAVKALSVMLKIAIPEAEDLLSRNGATVLREGVSEDDAKALQTILGKIGIRCNYRPALRSPHTLEIVQVEMEEDRPRGTVCPECNSKISVDKGQPMPELCPSCGLVFAKHEQLMREKVEREKIRRKLLNAQRLHEAESQRQAERRAEAEHREKLEQEVREELRLPKVLGTRTRLVGSATALFLIGLTSGVLGSRMLLSPEQPLPPPAAGPALLPAVAAGTSDSDPEIWMERPGATGNVDASLQLLVAMETMASKGRHSSRGGRAPMTFSPGWKLPDMDRVAINGVERSESPASEGVKERRSDTSLPVQRKIGRGSDAVDALGRMALDHLEQGNNAVAMALMTEMRRRAEALPGGLESVRALAKAAYFERESGDQRQADDLLEKGLQQARRLSAGAERGLALAAVAATAARTGQSEQGEQMLREANRELMAIADPENKLTALCGLAEYYGMAGQRGGALGLVDFVAQSVPEVQPAERQIAIYLHLARAHARLEDPSGALEVIGRIDAPERREAALYDVTAESATTGHVVWGSELASRLQSPRYASPAFAILGEAQSARQGPNSEALQSFSKAESWSKLVTDPSDKLRVLGQLGQAYALSGKADSSTAVFDTAVGIARTLTDPKERAQALDAIAEDQLDALLTDQALSTAALIADPALKAEMQRKIEDARRVAAILRPGSA